MEKLLLPIHIIKGLTDRWEKFERKFFSSLRKISRTISNDRKNRRIRNNKLEIKRSWMSYMMMWTKLDVCFVGMRNYKKSSTIWRNSKGKILHSLLIISNLKYMWRNHLILCDIHVSNFDRKVVGMIFDHILPIMSCMSNIWLIKNLKIKLSDMLKYSCWAG